MSRAGSARSLAPWAALIFLLATVLTVWLAWPRAPREPEGVAPSVAAEAQRLPPPPAGLGPGRWELSATGERVWRAAVAVEPEAESTPGPALERAIVGRLVDGEGRPHAEELLGVAIQISLRASRGRRTNHQEVRTDREGRFRYVPVEPIDAQATDHKLFVGLASDRRYPVVTPLPRVLPPGETDVGDVVWEVPPLLVSGVVVDGLGRPVAGARISVYSGRTRLHRQWTSIGDSSDEAGRFEVYADVQASPLSAEAAREGYYPGPRAAFEAPASQLRVLLHSSSTIEGRLLLDPRVPTELVTVEAVIESEDNAARPARVSRSDHPEPGTGGFRIDALPPGRARVEVQRTGTSTPLVAFDSVALLEGEPVRDARLDLIDLRGMLFAIRVGAVDEAGAPIGHARAAALGTVRWK